jgi:hypothetical protein
MNQPAPASNATTLENRCANWILRAAGSLMVAAAALLAGCETSRLTMAAFSSPYKPDNIFIAAPQLPGDLKRVAVLPLACGERRTDLVEGRDALGPALAAELIKAKKFEVVEVSPDELSRLTGRVEWTGAEVLPAGFLDSLQKKFGCDAVLFCELTEFHAYPPLAVGWRLRLVAVHGQKTLWDADEQFDAGKPAVMAGARLYQQQEQRQMGDENAGWLALNSPRWFGQYSLACLLDTLPAR